MPYTLKLLKYWMAPNGNVRWDCIQVLLQQTAYLNPSPLMKGEQKCSCQLQWALRVLSARPEISSPCVELGVGGDVAVLGFVYRTSVFPNLSKELHNVGNREINSWLLQYNVVLVTINQAYGPEIWL